MRDRDTGHSSELSMPLRPRLFHPGQPEAGLRRGASEGNSIGGGKVGPDVEGRRVLRWLQIERGSREAKGNIQPGIPGGRRADIHIR